LRFAIEYKQVYAHNRESIVAGSHTYHSYMGNLERGWMYTLPVSDVLIRSPLLYSTYNFGGRVFSPMDALNRELEKMTARYRTGAGNGASVVTPATSCVQDSHAALYAALVKFERAIQQDSSIQKWLAANPGSVEANFMGTNNPHTEYSLPSLIEKVRAQILPHFKIPQFWEENATELAVSRKQLQGFATTLAGLNQSATLFPRSANDFMLTLLVRSFGARLWAIRSDGVGGYLPGLEPIPPTSILVPK
jgi:predicted Abi (CAAX) family protease